jgi:hypothetical protein
LEPLDTMRGGGEAADEACIEFTFTVDHCGDGLDEWSAAAAAANTDDRNCCQNSKENS